MEPRSRSPAKDTAGPGAEADSTGMGRGWRPSRGNEAVGSMPDTYGYRSTRPEPGKRGLGAAPRGEDPPSERCPDGRLVILLAALTKQQESCAIAKVTAQCALHMSAMNIFGTP